MVRSYDLVMTHLLDSDDYFIVCVQQRCAERGMSFFLVEPLWLAAFHEHLQAGRLHAKSLLNMHSEHHDPADPYHRLIRLAHERGVQVIDPPDAAIAAFDKARIHPRLLEAGFDLPYTVVVDRDHISTFSLSEEQRLALGQPFVIKPAMGYGRRGVILDATDVTDLVRSAEAWPDRAYLLQQRIIPRLADGEPVYVRAYYVFGDLFLCWWNCQTDRYRQVEDAERQTFGLDSIEPTLRRMAALTGLRFFSSEVALTDEGKWVLIDYVNDQCHMLSQTANPQIGVPDPLVRAIARRLVDGAAELIAGPAPESRPAS